MLNARRRSLSPDRDIKQHNIIPRAMGNGFIRLMIIQVKSSEVCYEWSGWHLGMIL